MASQLCAYEQLRLDNMAEFKVEYKLKYNKSPLFGQNLKSAVKVSKAKQRPPIENTAASRSSDRIKQKPTPVYREEPVNPGRMKPRRKLSEGKVDQPTEDPKKDFECSDCGKTFTLISSLKRHSISQHTEQMYTCDFCFKSFLRLDSVKRHKDIYHKGGPCIIYNCKICTQSFQYKQNLKRHEMKFH
eukprot:GFUD01041915.1.p1 GENE.GFUD01041915.1~~GFUD01041915.1.p1  ORF type:complete len:187 (-),score=26.97 GFUD01041915.1:43-603(-)